MKFRTSFFNLTVLKKNITRFLPLWVGYTVFLFLILFGMSTAPGPAHLANSITQMMMVACVGNLIYAGFVAGCLFSDWYKLRLCSALHAFPIRREGWLLMNILTGFAFSILPNLLMCTVASFLLEEYAFYVWILFAVSVLQYIFFFGTAVLSVFCAGNHMGMLYIYGIIQFVAVLVYFLAKTVYEPLIYGIKLDAADFLQFMPITLMVTPYVEAELIYNLGIFRFYGYITEAWVHLGICTVVGVGCFGLAILTYRKRHLERAGDFVTVRFVKPVFLVIYTITVGTIFYAFSCLVGVPTYVLYGVGVVIGYFSSRMLLERTVRVFTKRAFAGFGVIAVVLAGSMLLTWSDPMGIGSYIPDDHRVKSASVYGGEKAYWYENYDQYSHFEITDPEEIAKLQDFHRRAIEVGAADEGQYDVCIRYNLTDGTVINRYYQYDYNDSIADEVKIWFSDIRYIYQINDPQLLYGLFGSFGVDRYSADAQNNIYESEDQAQIKGLLDAIMKDCAAGNMAQYWQFHRKDGSQLVDEAYSVHFNPAADSEVIGFVGYWGSSLRIYRDCTHTVAYLDSLYKQTEAE